MKGRRLALYKNNATQRKIIAQVYPALKGFKTLLGVCEGFTEEKLTSGKKPPVTMDIDFDLIKQAITDYNAALTA